MLLGLLVVASFALFGCASPDGGGSTNPDEENPIIPDVENPLEQEPSQPIEDDNSKLITIDGDKIFVDGEEYGRVEGTFVYREIDGEEKLVGSVGTDWDGTTAFFTFSPIEGGVYYFTLDNGRVVVDWSRTIVDGAWGVSPGVPGTMMITPEMKSRARAKAKAARARAKDSRAQVQRY